jgi:serine/threonine protein kinase/tetratricopeptide (TPR) repeat protein
MTRNGRWLRIQALFDQIADLPESERAETLAEQCADDPELRARVEALIERDHHRRDDPLSGAVGAAAESLLEDHRDRLIGARVGAYRIVSILGQGGMSTVYRGERDDARFQQTVAIKVLQHAVAHPRLRSRLHSERHILATLDHPGIARLIDSGELEDATPYLVMEYVDGESIDAYCDGRTLFLRERIELFIEVCAAVHYAHRNLVVHRDIKASNIHVTCTGTPKLLDFGIAKLLAPESLSHTLPVTRLQERMLTPENAAPEQVLGRPITTATDVYALGVLLYQLLCGRSPYRLLSYSQLQLERAICMDDPVRPSQSVVSRMRGESDGDRSRISERRGLTPQRLRARLSGDLDAIVAMAMRKEPDRRYPSVEALAQDLRRHVQGLPVLARHGDWRYKTAKFARRHSLAAAAASTIFVGLLLIAGVTLWQNHRISLARDAAALERDRAQQVSAFLVDVFSQADPFNAQGKDATARELLDSGAQKISANSNLQPEVRAQLLESIALAYRHLGLNDRAVELFEQALAIRRDERPPSNRAIAESLSNLARALADAGHLLSAEEYLQQAIELSQAEDASPSRETAEILVQYGHFALNGKSDPARALALFSQGLAIYRSLPGDQNLGVASTLSAMAVAATWSGDFAVSERYQRDALRIFRATVSRNHPDHAVALASLGYILTQRGKYAEAEQALNEALDIDRDVFGAGNQRIATLEKDLGTLYAREGDLRRAIDITQDAVRIASESLGPSHYLRGYCLDSLAHLKLQANDINGAEADTREALGIYAARLPARHLYVASSRHLLGEILLRRRLLVEAESELRAAVDIDTALAGEDSWRSARSRASLGWVLIEEGKAVEGEPLLIAAQSRLLATVGGVHPETQQATSRLVQYFQEHHREADATRVRQQSGTL